MERFTGVDEQGYYMPRNVTLNCLKQRGECVDRLGAYEDTGLMPEEVTALQRNWSDLCTVVGGCGGLDRLRELAEAALKEGV